jgi:hypothetical protein
MPIDTYYTPQEIAVLLKLSAYTVRKLAVEKKIARKINNRIYVSEHDLKKLLGEVEHAANDKK